VNVEPLDMRLVNNNPNRVSFTYSNSILSSPRIEDLPINPAKGKVQKSQPTIRIAYPSKPNVNKTDYKK
jgi:hypothetical protein